MKKELTMLVAAMIIFGLICVIGSATAAVAVDTAKIDWESYFGTSNFNGDAFVNKTVETDVEKRELKKDWKIKDGRIFKPDWANETRHSNFPDNWFNETPREKYTDKPKGWFEVNWITPGISG